MNGERAMALRTMLFATRAATAKQLRPAPASAVAFAHWQR